MLEKSFNEHTNSILDKPISAYEKPEKNAEIPMMILSPTEIANGRKVLISSTGISFLSMSSSYECKFSVYFTLCFFTRKR